HSWAGCRRSVELPLIGDWVKEFQDAVSTVISTGHRVLVYSGKEDYICNYFGGRQWTITTKWADMSEFQKAPFQQWIVNGSVAGQVKAYGPLTFLQIEAAGHMVPRDQPKNALDMLEHFLGNKPFNLN
uniref:Carboxypeptidase n=1 Tax=Amphimedon queenslandica TaxID=400682 RepID=A0A1X7SU73_AMPQE